jgi:PPOX class probable F420-dependent enzyme
MESTTTVVLSDRVREFLGRPLYPSLATAGPDGEPHQAVIWFRLEPDGRILVNSRTGRRWPTELTANRRASFAFTDLDDPFRWVGVQAVVDEVVDDVERARDDIVSLAVRYDEADEESEARFRSQPRISFLLRITSLHDHLED